MNIQSKAINLQKLTISPANEEQKLEITKHVTDHWGSPEAGLQYFTRLQSLIESKDYASGGKLTYW
jgi:hypothetical protein